MPAAQGLSAEQTAARESKRGKIIQRVRVSLILIGSALVIVWLGHPYLIALVALIQVGLFKELVDVRYKACYEQQVSQLTSLKMLEGKWTTVGEEGSGEETPRSRKAPVKWITIWKGDKVMMNGVTHDWHFEKEGDRLKCLERPQGWKVDFEKSNSDEVHWTLKDKTIVWTRIKAPLFRTLQWSLFHAAMLHTYKSEFERLGLLRSIWSNVHKYSSAVTFSAYVVILIVFVLTLKKEILKYQITNMFWTIAMLCLTVLQIRGVTMLIFEGIIWFIIPVGLVVANDSFAYICGMSMGKKFISSPFLSISPNKTWEGFIGAAFCTVAFAWFFADFFSQFPRFICPQMNLQPYAQLNCTASSTFVEQPLPLPFADYALFTINYKPVQFHATILACFASIVAPFGGFLASGMKRAFNIKDFGDLFPGHGGFMDRMDCQLLMLLGTYVYFQTFVRDVSMTEEHVLQILSSLPNDSRLRIVQKLNLMITASRG